MGVVVGVRVGVGVAVGGKAVGVSEGGWGDRENVGSTITIVAECSNAGGVGCRPESHALVNTDMNNTAVAICIQAT